MFMFILSVVVDVLMVDGSCLVVSFILGSVGAQAGVILADNYLVIVFHFTPFLCIWACHFILS